MPISATFTVSRGNCNSFFICRSVGIVATYGHGQGQKATRGDVVYSASNAVDVLWCVS